MQFDPERCRSLLFVPAGNERFLNSALRGDADVIQIDLEDAIAPNQKEVAREHAKKDIAVMYMGGGPYAKSSGPTLIDEAGVISKLGVSPQKVVDLKALTGDSSDNYGHPRL